MRYQTQAHKSLRLKIMVFFSFVVAFFLTALPVPYWAAWFRPEWALLFLLYWLVNYPQQVGLGVAFIVGVCLDCLYGSVLGLHSIALVITAYGVSLSQRTLRNYALPLQMIVILFFAVLYQCCILVVYAILKQQVPYFWAYWAPALICSFLWPWISLFLNSRLQRVRA